VSRQIGVGKKCVGGLVLLEWDFFSYGGNKNHGFLRIKLIAIGKKKGGKGLNERRTKGENQRENRTRERERLGAAHSCLRKTLFQSAGKQKGSKLIDPHKWLAGGVSGGKKGVTSVSLPQES